MKNFTLLSVAKTDTGLVRTHNEDAVVLDAAHDFAILADGMGGYNAGEVASDMASSIVAQYLSAYLRLPRQEPQSAQNSVVRNCMVEAIQLANRVIVDAAEAVPQYQGMGTTLVMAVCHARIMTVAHVGDSRAYLFRRNALTQLTRDHSLLQEQVDAGLLPSHALHSARNKNIITRAVGIDYALEVDLHDHAVEPGDLYLLCSDGLSDMLSNQQLSEILALRQQDNRPDPARSLAASCNTLINSANAHGGLDNISVVLMQVLPVIN